MINRLSIAPDSLDHISFVEVVCSDQDKDDMVQVARKLGHRIIHAHQIVAAECEKQGRFHVGDRVFHCRVIEGQSHDNH